MALTWRGTQTWGGTQTWQGVTSSTDATVTPTVVAAVGAVPTPTVDAGTPADVTPTATAAAAWLTQYTQRNALVVMGGASKQGVWI